jgi:sec-independent protein translocase protein TatA
MQQKATLIHNLINRKEINMPFGIQPLHILIVIVVALLVFGPKRLPEIGRYVGRTITEFRSGTQELTENFREEVRKPVVAQTMSATSSQSASAPVVAGGNFCTQCGASNSSEARFCGSCGTRLPEKSA